jgi:predicted GNAT family N-acyltransferase/uncharacterized SAM-binding protein YcdF (DUF218 family)
MMFLGYLSLFVLVVVLWSLRRLGRVLDESEHVSCEVAVVLGARVNEGGEPSGALIRRVDHGVDQLREGRAARLLFTGGPYRGRESEARVGLERAAGQGVAKALMSMEEWSCSTAGNARHARHLLGETRVLVVTDAYHARRARLEFERYFEGVEVTAPQGPRMPGPKALLREMFGTGRALWRRHTVRPKQRPRREWFRSVESWELGACLALRRRVFQEEGGVPRGVEVDGRDEQAMHWIGIVGGHVVATARAREVGDGNVKIERVAVDKAHRGKALGARLMREVHRDLHARGVCRAKLHAQVTVEGFYEALGYETHGEVFLEAAIEHVEMWLDLKDQSSA